MCSANDAFDGLACAHERAPVRGHPFTEDLLDPARKTFKSADEIRWLYESRGLLPSHEVIAYCQVGHRSSVDLFALHLIGYDRLRNYYGAWEEWGSRMELPVVLLK